MNDINMGTLLLSLSLSFVLISHCLLSIIARTYHKSHKMELPTQRESLSPPSGPAHPSFEKFFGRHLLKESSPMKLGQYYFANSTFADMWQGNMSGKTVAVKVWRGVSLPISTYKSLEMVSSSLVVTFLRG
jgi:hypothetical protein